MSSLHLGKDALSWAANTQGDQRPLDSQGSSRNQAFPSVGNLSSQHSSLAGRKFMSPKLYFDLKEKLMDKHRLATVQGFPLQVQGPSFTPAPLHGAS